MWIAAHGDSKCVAGWCNGHKRSMRHDRSRRIRIGSQDLDFLHTVPLSRAFLRVVFGPKVNASSFVCAAMPVPVQGGIYGRSPSGASTAKSAAPASTRPPQPAASGRAPPANTPSGAAAPKVWRRNYSASWRRRWIRSTAARARACQRKPRRRARRRSRRSIRFSDRNHYSWMGSLRLGRRLR